MYVCDVLVGSCERRERKMCGWVRAYVDMCNTVCVCVREKEMCMCSNIGMCLCEYVCVREIKSPIIR